MRKELIIMLVEDDIDHAELVTRYLRYAGIDNEILYFENRDKIVDFLFGKGDGNHYQRNISYIILLDISENDSYEFIEKIKQDDRLRMVPIFVFTNADDSNDMEKYYSLGCSICIRKTVDYERFKEIIKCMGCLIISMEIPVVNSEI